MNNIRRICSLLLVLAMVLAFVPVSGAARAEKENDLLEKTGAGVPTEEAYATADALFEQIDAAEAQLATKNSSQAEVSKAAAELVKASDCYVEGSLEFNGDAFSWWTEGGIRCMYNPRMEKIHDEMVPAANADQNVIFNEPTATKAGGPSGNQVYLVAPYYGYDSSFTDQYKNEAIRIANGIGDTDGYTLYSGSAATVDKVADAVANGAVVIFDSHGTTDYSSGSDYVSGATSSYLCLTNTSGVTSADYSDGAGYLSGGGVAVNGVNIANHMTGNSPAGLVWMAICLSMATDTMAEPLREKGVEVAYGYSQSVTFGGDYLFEDAFWDKMLEGKNVAQSIAYMKETWGNWDWSTQIARNYGYSDGYTTIEAARADYSAFPIVVSDEDAHPGQRNRSGFYGACSLQNVLSTYSLDGGSSLPEEPEVPEGQWRPGDLDDNGTVNEADAIYALQHVLAPDLFPVNQPIDFDANGTVNEMDAIYLLMYVLWPELFPVSNEDYGEIRGTVASAENRTDYIEGAQIQVLKYPSLASQTTVYSDAQGAYQAIVPGDTYKVKISANGYIPFESLETVPAGQTVYLETYLLVEGNVEDNLTGNIGGIISNSVTGSGISNVTLTVREGWNMLTGDVVTTTQTSNSGSYSLNLPLGNYTIYMEHSGFVSGHFNVAVTQTTNNNCHGVMTPDGSGTVELGDMRIVLTWGASPRDLDSHLWGPTVDGTGMFHIYYSNMNYSSGGVRRAYLDVDDTTSYGPETTTVYDMTANGTYSFFVHDYTNLSSSSSTAMSNSGAQVKVYMGESLIATYNIPTSRVGTVWHVFDFDATTGTLTGVNTFSSCSNPSDVGRPTRAVEIVSSEAYDKKSKEF